MVRGNTQSEYLSAKLTMRTLLGEFPPDKLSTSRRMVNSAAKRLRIHIIIRILVDQTDGRSQIVLEFLAVLPKIMQQPKDFTSRFKIARSNIPVRVDPKF